MKHQLIIEVEINIKLIYYYIYFVFRLYRIFNLLQIQEQQN